MRTAADSYVRVPRAEYMKLKDLEKRFARFWSYFEHLHDIREGRGQIAKRRTVPQEKLFADLGV